MDSVREIHSLFEAYSNGLDQTQKRKCHFSPDLINLIYKHLCDLSVNIIKEDELPNKFIRLKCDIEKLKKREDELLNELKLNCVNVDYGGLDDEVLNMMLEKDAKSNEILSELLNTLKKTRLELDKHFKTLKDKCKYMIAYKENKTVNEVSRTSKTETVYCNKSVSVDIDALDLLNILCDKSETIEIKFVKLVKFLKNPVINGIKCELSSVDFDIVDDLDYIVDGYSGGIKENMKSMLKHHKHEIELTFLIYRYKLVNFIRSNLNYLNLKQKLSYLDNNEFSKHEHNKIYFDVGHIDMFKYIIDYEKMKIERDLSQCKNNEKLFCLINQKFIDIENLKDNFNNKLILFADICKLFGDIDCDTNRNTVSSIINSFFRRFHKIHDYLVNSKQRLIDIFECNLHYKSQFEQDLNYLRRKIEKAQLVLRNSSIDELKQDDANIGFSLKLVNYCNAVKYLTLSVNLLENSLVKLITLPECINTKEVINIVYEIKFLVIHLNEYFKEIPMSLKAKINNAPFKVFNEIASLLKHMSRGFANFTLNEFKIMLKLLNEKFISNISNYLLIYLKSILTLIEADHNFELEFKIYDESDDNLTIFLNTQINCLLDELREFLKTYNQHIYYDRRNTISKILIKIIYNDDEKIKFNFNLKDSDEIKSRQDLKMALVSIDKCFEIIDSLNQIKKTASYESKTQIDCYKQCTQILDLVYSLAFICESHFYNKVFIHAKYQSEFNYLNLIKNLILILNENVLIKYHYYQEIYKYFLNNMNFEFIKQYFQSFKENLSVFQDQFQSYFNVYFLNSGLFFAKNSSFQVLHTRFQEFDKIEFSMDVKNEYFKIRDQIDYTFKNNLSTDFDYSIDYFSVQHRRLKIEHIDMLFQTPVSENDQKAVLEELENDLKFFDKNNYLIEKIDELKIDFLNLNILNINQLKSALYNSPSEFYEFKSFTDSLKF